MPTDYQRQAQFDRAQAAYDRMAPDESEAPSAPCPYCGEDTDNGTADHDEDGRSWSASACDICAAECEFCSSPRHECECVCDTCKEPGQLFSHETTEAPICGPCIQREEGWNTGPGIDSITEADPC